MRKVRYYVNDDEYVRDILKYPKDICDLMNPSFKVIFTIWGYEENENTPNKSRITDWNGNKIHRNDLNGYERGVVLAGCYRHFEGTELPCDMNNLWGVVKIEEERITGSERE